MSALCEDDDGWVNIEKKNESLEGNKNKNKNQKGGGMEGRKESNESSDCIKMEQENKGKDFLK